MEKSKVHLLVYPRSVKRGSTIQIGVLGMPQTIRTVPSNLLMREVGSLQKELGETGISTRTTPLPTEDDVQMVLSPQKRRALK